MAHHPQNHATATTTRSSVSPALLGALALLAVGLFLVMLGPQLLSFLSTEQTPQALAAGVALLGTAAMISALSLLARDIERHAFASLAPVLAAFSGCVLWALDVELKSIPLPLKHLGLLSIVTSVIAGAAIVRGTWMMRMVGWMVCLLTPGSLVSLLWIDSGRASLLEGVVASDLRARLLVGMALATSFLLALFAEATRGLASTRALAPPRRATVTSYQAHAGTHLPAAAYAAAQPPIAAPAAPSLVPHTQRALQPTLIDDNEEDFHAMLRPRRSLAKISGMALVGAAAAAIAFLAVRSLSGPPEAGAELSETLTDESAPAATEPSEIAAGVPIAPEPREQEPTDFKPTVEPLVDTESVPTDEALQAPAPSAPAGATDPEASADHAQSPMAGPSTSPGPEANAAGEDEPTQPEVTSAPKSSARAARAPNARAKARARARQAPQAKARPPRAKRARIRRARARRAAAQRPRAPAKTQKADTKPQRPKAQRKEPEPKPEAKPKPEMSSPDDSIEALMEGAVRNKKGANDPIFGL